MDNKLENLKQHEDLDAYSYHEMVDRSFIVMSQIQDLLIDHAVVECHPELRENLEKAQKAIWEVYQTVGAVHLSQEEND